MFKITIKYHLDKLYKLKNLPKYVENAVRRECKFNIMALRDEMLVQLLNVLEGYPSKSKRHLRTGDAFMAVQEFGYGVRFTINPVSDKGFNYLGVVEYGRGPVTTTNAPYLMFQGREGGWIKTKSVKGFQGHHFIENSINRYFGANGELAVNVHRAVEVAVQKSVR